MTSSTQPKEPLGDTLRTADRETVEAIVTQLTDQLEALKVESETGASPVSPISPPAIRHAGTTTLTLPHDDSRRPLSTSLSSSNLVLNSSRQQHRASMAFGGQSSNPASRAVCAYCGTQLAGTGAASLNSEIGYCCVDCEGVLSVDDSSVTPMPNRANGAEFESTQTLNEDAYFASSNEAVSSTVCEACQEPLGDEYINIHGRRFHVMHFLCHDCRIPLYALGGYLQDPVGGEKFYCQRDYLQHYAPNCHACAIPITSGEMVIALGRTYHSECFVCSICQSPFVGDECYEHDGQPLCEWHWYIQNGRLCVECGAIIKEHCVMTRGKKYHQKCAEQKYNERAVSLEEAKRRVRAHRANA